MASELHSRLEYLVNYSSQLIFVSGDSIAEQQRTLEAFVFQQSDNTELAFITAEPDMSVTDYRGTLCRQLLNQTVGTFIRPLNELLAGLNHHAGPVLITITQAQYLPNDLLQELWDLVLQSRFANNKQHLNVLLFGESDWAEQAKQWLPAKNTSTPLLISSQSVSRDHYSSDVDRLLAERRAAFDRYRKERGELTAPPPGNNRLHSPWLWIAVSMVFISSFIGIMGWQYGATLSTLFNPIETTSRPPAKIPDGASAPLSKPVTTLSIEKHPSEVKTTTAASETATDTVTPSVPTAFTTTSINQPASDVSQSEATVMRTFNEGLKAIPAASTESPVQAFSAASPALNSQNEKQQPAQSPVALTSGDSTHHADLDQPATANTTLAAATTNQYWLQIAGMKDYQLAQDFLSDHSLTDKVTLYKTYRYGGDWYVILWSTHFDALSSAQQALATLPDFPGRESVFIKSTRQIQTELQRQP